MPFMNEDDSVLVKYNEIWNKIKKTLNIKFHSMPVREKVKEFNGVVNTNFWGDKVRKEGMHHTCIACVSIDSVTKMGKRNYAQVYLEECKFKMKKKKMSKFIDNELGLHSDSNSE